MSTESTVESDETQNPDAGESETVSLSKEEYESLEKIRKKHNFENGARRKLEEQIAEANKRLADYENREKKRAEDGQDYKSLLEMEKKKAQTLAEERDRLNGYLEKRVTSLDLLKEAKGLSEYDQALANLARDYVVTKPSEDGDLVTVPKDGTYESLTALMTTLRDEFFPGSEPNKAIPGTGKVKDPQPAGSSPEMSVEELSKLPKKERIAYLRDHPELQAQMVIKR